MAHLVVPDFVGKNGLDFLDLHLVDQGIVQYDPPEFPKAGKISIGMTGTLASVNHLNSLRVESGFLRQRHKAVPQFPLLERRELVKKGNDELGPENHEQQLDAEKYNEDQNPPTLRECGRNGTIKPNHQGEQEERQDETQNRAFYLVRNPKPFGRFVKTSGTYENWFIQ